MKNIFVLLLFTLSSAAFAEVASPGMTAFAKIAPASTSFSEGNFRAGCQAFGEYLAYKAMANKSNTDQWTLRNLSFGEESEAVLADFCSGPKSAVTKEAAAAAAASIEGNAGLESVTPHQR